jgi:hypothetical protein
MRGQDRYSGDEDAGNHPEKYRQQDMELIAVTAAASIAPYAPAAGTDSKGRGALGHREVWQQRVAIRILRGAHGGLDRLDAGCSCW